MRHYQMKPTRPAPAAKDKEQAGRARQAGGMDNWMQLQQTAGNHAVQRMLASSMQPVQRMESSETEEEELQMKRDETAQRMESPESEEEELQMKRDETAQRMESPEAEEEELQMKRDETAQRMESPESEEEELQMKRDETAQRKSDNGGLPGGVRAKMEASMGADFSGVRIHEGSEAADIGALAYTRGTDIHFAPGQYDPVSKSGQELLGHELSHVIQQRQGRVKPTMETNGVPVNDDRSLEQEADDMGRRAANFSLAPSAAGVQRKEDGHQAFAMRLMKGKKDGEAAQMKSSMRR